MSSRINDSPIFALPSPALSTDSDSDSNNIIDLNPFNHSPPPRSSSSFDQPSQPPLPPPDQAADDAFTTQASEFMRRIFAIVPPSSPPPSAVSALVHRSSTAPSSPRRSAERDLNRVSGESQRGGAGVVEGTLSGIGKWWAGDAKGKGKETETSTSNVPRGSLDGWIGRPRDSISSTPSTPTKAKSPPSLLSNFPTFPSTLDDPKTPSSELTEELASALLTPLPGLPATPSTITAQLADGLPDSPTTPNRPRTLYSSSTFHAPEPLTPPPQAHLVAPSSPSTTSKLPRTRVAPPPLLFSPSLHRPTPLPATSSLIRGFERDLAASSSSASSLGLGSSPRPTLQRSMTLSSIDSLRTLQTRGFSSSDGGGGKGMEGTSAWWREHKKLTDNMLEKEDQGETVEEEQENIQKRHTPPKNPIVFCHGLFGFDILGPASLPPLQISHWRGIREILEANGAEVFITRVPATSSIEERAKILMKSIEDRYPGREVNLVGHSMGGLDCRFLASRLKPTSFKIASLTTIATPHRGSPFADYVINEIIGRTHFPAFLNLLDVLRLPNQGDGAAFDALSTVSMAKFNEETPDDPEVDYYSWGAQFEPSYFNTFKWPHSVIFPIEGPNDGLVSVKSAEWGKSLGVLEGVNHLDLVGWVNQVRYTLSEWAGKPIAFKPATFYLELADYLAEAGH
ncbi:Alpha/Beta hydrolase protein [Mrakia frigida]|uniref:Alpha/Beta hydrolase protein n=1 Tax=Mrakia frigida TaxID=29902 RepID=UPI003FCC0ACB